MHSSRHGIGWAFLRRLTGGAWCRTRDLSITGKKSGAEKKTGETASCPPQGCPKPKRACLCERQGHRIGGIISSPGHWKQREQRDRTFAYCIWLNTDLDKKQKNAKNAFWWTGKEIWDVVYAPFTGKHLYGKNGPSIKVILIFSNYDSKREGERNVKPLS